MGQQQKNAHSDHGDSKHAQDTIRGIQQDQEGSSKRAGANVRRHDDIVGLVLQDPAGKALQQMQNIMDTFPLPSDTGLTPLQEELAQAHYWWEQARSIDANGDTGEPFIHAIERCWAKLHSIRNKVEGTEYAVKVKIALDQADDAYKLARKEGHANTKQR
jgi:hypothetical protein